VIVGVDAQENKYHIKFDQIYDDDSGMPRRQFVPVEDVYSHNHPRAVDFKFLGDENSFRIEKVVDKSKPPKAYLTKQRMADYELSVRKPMFRIRWLGWGAPYDDWVSLAYLQKLQKNSIQSEHFDKLVRQATKLAI
jgi:hypothetical protein